LEFKVSGTRALRLEPNSLGAPNVLGGAPVNFIGPGVVGAVIAGGGATNYYGLFSTNSVSGDFGTVGGGGINTIQTATYSTIGGGYSNTIQPNASGSTIGGGSSSTIQVGALYSTVGGGYVNTIQTNAYGSTIGGGEFNTNSGPLATVPGGDQNVAGPNSLAAGHRAKAIHQGSFVWADSNQADFASSGVNQFLIRAAGGVGINKANPAAALDVNGTISASTFQGNGSGLSNLQATNLTGAIPTTVLSNAWGTAGNVGTSAGTQFIGTSDNQPLEFKVNGTRALRIEPNTNNAPNMIGGSPANFVAPGIPGVVIAGGGLADPVNPSDTNSVYARFSSIGGGSGNRIQANDSNSTIGGGWDNTIQNDSPYSTIGGGVFNIIQTNADVSTIAGGVGHAIQSGSPGATIGGGYQNTIGPNGYYSTIGGGLQNAASGQHATVPGGSGNAAAGDLSFAAGYRAKALHDGSFVWADSTSTDFASTTNNQFSVLASGGLVFAGDVSLSGDSRYHNLSLSGGNSVGYLYGSDPALADGIHLGYNWYADNAGAGHVFNHSGATSRISAGYGFIDLVVGNVNSAPTNVMLHVTTGGICANGTISNCSDRNAKQDFAPVSPSEVLDRVLQLPVSQWSYRVDPATRHIGPMAQDFYEAFNVGMDDKHIATIDESGVALAAIQGLNQKLEVKIKNADARTDELVDLSRKLEIENAELKLKYQSLERRIQTLEQIVLQQQSK
jgi:hypothetical protein